MKVMSEVKLQMSALETELRELAKERILVLDGAWGTMIQALSLDESGYRGARFDAWNREVRGNNDILNISKPEAIRDISLAILPRGRGYLLDQHVFFHAYRAGRLRHGRILCMNSISRVRSSPRKPR
jgi:hypothetical protein